MVRFAQDLDRLDLDVREALCSIELAFPRSEWVIMVHLMAHFVDQIRDIGPVRATWMYPQEGFLGHIKRAVKNRFRPEATIVARWAVDQGVELLRCALSAGKEVPAVNAEAPDVRVYGNPSIEDMATEDMAAIRAWIMANYVDRYDTLLR